MNEEKPLELEREYIALNPKQWLDIGNALMVAGNQLDFARTVYHGDPAIESKLVTGIYASIDVLNKVHARAKESMDDSEVSANAMLESIYDQLTGISGELYPLLNEEDKRQLVEAKKEFAKKLNKHFADQVFTRLSEDEEVVEKFDNEESLHGLVEETYSGHLDGMVDEAFGEVLK